MTQVEWGDVLQTDWPMGADVVFCDLSEEVTAVEAECAGYERDIKGVICNVADENQVNELVSTAAEHMGGLNDGINNAEIIRDGMLAKVDHHEQICNQSAVCSKGGNSH